MNILLCLDYIRAYHCYQQAKADLERIKAEMDGLERQLIEQFAQDGVQSVRTKDGLLCLNRHLYAHLTGEPEALLGTDFAYLVQPKVNQTSLSAAVRDLPTGDDGLPLLPADIAASVKVNEVWRLGVRA